MRGICFRIQMSRIALFITFMLETDANSTRMLGKRKYFIQNIINILNLPPQIVLIAID